jgi:hypothetical protein
MTLATPKEHSIIALISVRDYGQILWRTVDAMDDEFDENADPGDNGPETSYPDIDSALEMYIGTGDYSYRTQERDGKTTHLIKRLKKGEWTEHLQIEDDEVRTFTNEEMTTYLIHQISMDRVMRRKLFGLIILFLGIAVPIAMYSIIVLSVDSLGMFIIAGGLSVSLFPIFCFLMSSAERSVDDRIYVTHHNFADVLQKMIDLQDEPYLKVALEKRLERLQGPNRTYTD